MGTLQIVHSSINTYKYITATLTFTWILKFMPVLDQSRHYQNRKKNSFVINQWRILSLCRF